MPHAYPSAKGDPPSEPPPYSFVGSGSALQDGGFVIEATRTLADDFLTPDRVWAHVVERILTRGLAVVGDLQARGEPTEVLEELLLELHACSGGHRSFESWCHRELPLALDAVQTDLKPILWAWRQLVGSVRGDV